MAIKKSKNKKVATGKKQAKPVKKHEKIPKVKLVDDSGNYHLICIGASAGGISAISDLISQLPGELNAAVFVVLHLSRSAMGEILVQRLRRKSNLPISLAADNETINPGHIYVAPPNVHTIIKEGKIALGFGPPENRFRPSIDVLFRSAGTAYGPRTTGIVMSGFLNDGAIGMWNIKQCGGNSIVQDPNEAEYPDMPNSVLETMDVDHCVPINKMGEIIISITGQTKFRDVKPPAYLVTEAKLSEKAATGIENVKEVGERTEYGCPDCGGSIYLVKHGKVKHYRCHVGHSYSENALLLRQAENTENSLWVAMRMMEERKILLKKTAKENLDRGMGKLSEQYAENAENLDEHILKLKELLSAINRD
jgi:two-component system, chemotaxis family, protein-glutamate methylesterase/glutaminase